MKTFDTFIIFEVDGNRVRILQDAQGLVWLCIEDFLRVLGISEMLCKFLIKEAHEDKLCFGSELGLADYSVWIRHDLAEHWLTRHLEDTEKAEAIKQRLQTEIIQPLTTPKPAATSPLLTLIPPTKHLKKDLTQQDYATAVNQLLAFAFQDTGGSKGCAMVLLTAYNDADYQLKFSDLGNLSDALYSAALVVIRARVELRLEPHEVINNGNHVFAELWQWWQGYQPVEGGAL